MGDWLAGAGDGQLRLAGRPAIPRGGGCGPAAAWLCGRPGRCARGQSPSSAGCSPWHRAAAAAQSGASPPLCLSQPACPTVGPASTAESRARALPAGAGLGAVQEPDVTPGCGSGGHGSAAHLQWGGNQGSGCGFAHAHQLREGAGKGRPRLPSAVGIQAPVATSGPG